MEDLKEQESVSRVLTELLESPEDYFDSEEDDVSTTNDYSSINEQVRPSFPGRSPCFSLFPFGLSCMRREEVSDFRTMITN